MNELIGFESLHYGSNIKNGVVLVKVVKKPEFNYEMLVRAVKKEKEEMQLGIRTIEGTAVPGIHYEPIDQSLDMKLNQSELTIIIKTKTGGFNENDLYFNVELYDKEDGLRLSGCDTRASITIQQEMEVGQFEMKYDQINVLREHGKAQIKIYRRNGCHGFASCIVKTE